VPNLFLILEMTQYLHKMVNKQRFKLTSRFYTKSNPRKGFTPVLSDWIKGLVLNFGVNLWCYPKIKWPNVCHCCRQWVTWCVIYMLQVSCVVRSYWKQTPSTLSDYKHSQQSYFVGLRVESVSLLPASPPRWLNIYMYTTIRIKDNTLSMMLMAMDQKQQKS